MSNFLWKGLVPTQEKTLLTETFERMIGVVTKEELLLLFRSVAIIAGCGGVGAIHAINLARSGVLNFIIGDMKCYRRENISRQYAAFESTIGKPKAEALKKMILDINPHANVIIFEEGFTNDNIDKVFQMAIEEFGKMQTVVVDGIDLFAMKMRLKLLQKAREYGVFAVTAAPLGFGTTQQVFHPEKMTFERYSGVNENASSIDNFCNFLTSLNPLPYHAKYMDLDKIILAQQRGSAVSAGVCAATWSLSSAVINILLRRNKIKCVPYFLNVDLGFQNDNFRKAHMFFGRHCPTKKFVTYLLKRQIIKKQKAEAEEFGLKSDFDFTY